MESEERLVLDWKKRGTARAAVLVTIETVPDQLPIVYTPQIYQQKCQTVYQHVFDSYQGQNQSLYVN
jgi:type I restriction enzyme R subunit